jgi:hypothetical protein
MSLFSASITRISAGYRVVAGVGVGVVLVGVGGVAGGVGLGEAADPALGEPFVVDE